MPRWIERVGTTFVLAVSGQTSGPRRYARLSLVEREGLWPVYNVQEARAEVRTRRGEAESLGDGRLLAWRWLTRREADRLWADRVATLEALGYEAVDSQPSVRGRWEWLRELVDRGLAASSVPTASPSEGGHTSQPNLALRDALERLGLRSGDLVEGVASVLGIHPVRLRYPDPETIRHVDGAALAIVLPFLLGHRDPELHRIGTVWIEGETTAFELPQGRVLQWLLDGGQPGRALQSTVRARGLALLGPVDVGRVARCSEDAEIRRAAAVWAGRLSSG